MKTSFSSFFLSICLMFTIGACGGGHGDHNHAGGESESQAQTATTALETPEAFRAGFKAALDAYFELKDALVETNRALAAEKSAELNRRLGAISSENLSAEAAMLWETAGGDATAASGTIRDEADVEQQRYHFETVSNAFIDMVKAFGPFENTIYRQTCPMVRGGSADWLSREENVMNPYHGSRMLRCGSVVERI